MLLEHNFRFSGVAMMSQISTIACASLPVPGEGPPNYRLDKQQTSWHGVFYPWFLSRKSCFLHVPWLKSCWPFFHPRPFPANPLLQRTNPSRSAPVLVRLIGLAGIVVPMLPSMLTRTHTATAATNMGEIARSIGEYQGLYNIALSGWLGHVA